MLLTTVCVGLFLFYSATARSVTSTPSLTSRAASSSDDGPACRYLPGDAGWPNETAWNQLNQTVEGRLLAGVPLARSCHSPYLDSEVCSEIQEEWILLDP